VGCGDAIPEVSSYDACGEVSMVSTDEIIQGECINEYIIIRHITATDACGNVTSAIQNIQVGDGGGPAITGVDTLICDDLNIPIVTAYDACAGQVVPVNMVQDTVDEPCTNGVVIIRTWSAIDLCGHVNEIRQRIIMNDNTAPEIQIPSYSIIRKFIENDSNFVMTSDNDMIRKVGELNENSVFVSDDCYYDLRFIKDSTWFDCIVSGYSLATQYKWIATDACDNVDSVTFTIYITDNTPPDFRLFVADTMIICAPLPEPPSMIVEDNIGMDTMNYTETIVPGADPGEWLVNRRWYALDLCGNVSVFEQQVFWIPETLLECAIILPESVECNSHGLIISSLVTGGLGDYTYEWQVVGEKCFIQSGQNTPEIAIYQGWSDVTIILTVTDSVGCISVCTTTLSCLFSFEVPFVQSWDTDGEFSVSNTITPEVQLLASDKEGSKNVLSLWPNPANRLLNIQFISSEEQIVTVSILNLIGQKVSGEILDVAKGENKSQIDMSRLPEGTYFIHAQTASEQLLQRVVVLH
ncbi:MAG: T9SS type A sorting domain-containing protein, partial [Bacteroidota bacterium]|nr:T9SS type A sorting domain-containing protein [Bacteroidota bacterium]